MTSVAIKYKPFTFYTATFVLTWSFWFLSILFIQNKKTETLLMLFGLIAPFGTALWLISSSKSEELKKNFLNRLFNIKLIKFNSLPAILLIPPASIIFAILISIPFGLPIQQFTIAKSFAFSMTLIPTGMVLFLAAFFEELGWRSYAMESLHSKFNYFNVTMTFGINISQEFFMVESATKCIQTCVLIVFALFIIYLKPEVFFDKK